MQGRQTEWIHVFNFSCNDSAASANAADKVATYQILTDAGLAAVPHILASTYVSKARKTTELMDYFGASPVVVKPLHGYGGLDVRRVDDLDAAIRSVNNSPIHAWALSPYIEVTKETRVVLWEGEILLAYEKTGPYLHDGLKLFNLSHGAKALTIPAGTLRRAAHDMAAGAVAAMNLTLAAVDIITDHAGNDAILEVNSGFSLEHYSLQSEENKTRAGQIYDEVVERLFR